MSVSVPDAADLRTHTYSTPDCTQSRTRHTSAGHLLLLGRAALLGGMFLVEYTIMELKRQQEKENNNQGGGGGAPEQQQMAR